ncbi:DUF2515 family protein [Pseudomonas sp. Leaf48]|uniref:DUF2515 family protein n=1 Tax=Pseudomonas sp. Leaf48 TaxID=1736221 RepID=UPI003FA6E0AE
MLHAAESVEKMQAEHEAGQSLMKSANKRFRLFGLGEPERQARLQDYQQAQRDYQQARRDNPVPGLDHRRDGEPLSLVQQQFQHVYEMLAMGNTTLFLDVYPLHVFYAERGLEALKVCLPSRKDIYGSGEHPVLWPVGQETLQFGIDHKEILLAFEAIESGNIPKSVQHLAWHEQQNILQPAMYSDWRFNSLLYSNHLSYLVGLPSGAAEAIELTLASQCRLVDDQRTVGFSKSVFADLSDIKQRMTFVLRAADQFDKLLHSDQRDQLERSIRNIALGGGVR